MKPKSNLTDVTFLIPVRLDSIDRLVNLKAVLRFLHENFLSNIQVLEADCFNTGLIKSIVNDSIDYIFIEDHDPIFFRTNYINQMVRNCKTPYLSVWDTDVIVPPDQILKSVEFLRLGQADFVYPYEKKFLDTSKIIRELYLVDNDWKVLDKHQKKMRKLYPPNPVGGAFLANREKYIESGIENLNFYGWGIEDGERVIRWNKLGYKYKRIQGNLYHLTHERGSNSTFHNDSQKTLKLNELSRISSMTKEELQEEVLGWHISIQTLAPKETTIAG